MTTRERTDHKGRPESSNWYTARRGGPWLDRCADCDRIVILTFRWRNGEPMEIWQHYPRWTR